MFPNRYDAPEDEDIFANLSYNIGDTVVALGMDMASLTITIDDQGGNVEPTWGRYSLTNPEERDELIPALFQLERVIDDAMIQARDLLVRDRYDEFSIRIQAVSVIGESMDFYISFSDPVEIDGRKILDTIENALNSSESILLPFDLIVTRRRKVRALNFNLIRGNKKWNLPLEEYVKSKRGIVKIHDTPPGHKGCCFAQFVLLGICHCLESRTLHVSLELEELGLNEKSYRYFTGKPERRPGKAAALMRLLESRNLDGELAEQVRQLFGVQIVLYSFNERNLRVYPNSDKVPRECADEPVICGMVSRGEEETLFSHVDFISNPASVVPSTSDYHRYCSFCYENYSRKGRCKNTSCQENSTLRCNRCHTCVGCCETCKTKICGKTIYGKECDNIDLILEPEQEPYPRRKYCGHCNAEFFSVSCEQQHERVCLDMVAKVCLFCSKRPHPGLACDEDRCYMCQSKVKLSEADQHVCYMKRLKMVFQPNTEYWTYDFETLTEHEETTGKTVLKLYLATAYPINVAPHKLTKLQQKFPHTFSEGCTQPVFVFWGLGDESFVKNGVYDFFRFVFQPEMSDAQFFAHNAGKFDAIFVERYLAKLGYVANVIRRGQKIIQLHYAALNLSFKDSLNFIPSSLRSMSSAFGIEELRKGFFPHKIMTSVYYRDAENRQFLVPKPERKWFEQDFRNNTDGKSEAKELDCFYQAFTAQPHLLWDLRKDAIEYCISDTVLLGKVLELFRKETMALSQPIRRAPGVLPTPFDPLQFVTLPGGVMRFYMSQFLPDKAGFIVDRHKWLNRRDSHRFVCWMEYRDQRAYEITDHETVCGRHYDANTNRWTFLLFLDCFQQGCSLCMSPMENNIRTGKLVIQSMWKLEQQMIDLRRQYPGCQILSIRTHEWIKLQEEKDYQDWFQENENGIDLRCGCDPRDCYKGGVSECYKLFVGNPYRIQVSDYVSQYPMVLIGESYHPLSGEKREWNMPTGQPKIVFQPNHYVFNEEIMGIIKCQVLAPPNCYAPFLSMKVPSAISETGMETLYGCCRLCMLERRVQKCTHSEQERAFIGTWTLSEIYFARQHGYRVLHVVEVWEYPGKSNALFRDFIIPFMIAKTCSKRGGIVNEDGNFTQTGWEVFHYIREISGILLHPDDFADAPAKRTVAKLIQNVLYGKMAQRTIWPETKIFRDGDEEETKQCLHLFYDSDVDIKYGEVISDFATVNGLETRVVIQFERKRAFTRGDAKKNDIWAAHVTAGGRQSLFEGIYSLKAPRGFPSPNYMIYCDTDSLDHIVPQVLPYRTGFRIGDLEPEVPDAYHFVGGGRKQYMYKLPDGKVVCKQKGVDIRVSMATRFVPENLLAVIHNTKRRYDEIFHQEDQDRTRAVKRIRQESSLPEEEFPQILVQETRLVTIPENPIIRRKEQRLVPKKTLFHAWALKRIVLWDQEQETGILDTRPFGYREE